MCESCGHVHGAACHGWAPVPAPYPPWGWPGWPACGHRPEVLLPQEQWLEPPAEGEPSATRTVFIGGIRPARLTLEYMAVDGAAAPSVEVTLVDAGATTTWSEAPIAAGFHVKGDLPPAAPGAKLTVTAKEAMARMRWCEVMEA